MLTTSKPIKKLLVKNFKGQRLPEDFEAASWDVLHTGLQSIFAGKQDSISLETCEDVCRCRLAHPLYSKLYAECELFALSFSNRVSLLMNSIDLREDPVKLLKAFDIVWQEYVGRIKTVCNVFLYLDRVFVMSRNELMPIWEMCMIHFRASALANPTVRPTLINAIINAMLIDRGTEMSELSLVLYNAVSMLTNLKLTDEWAKMDIFNNTKNFFTQESKNKMTNASIADYLEYANGRINEERLRYNNYGFDSTFKAELVDLVQTCVFANQLVELLTNGLEELVRAKNDTKLKLLYELCSETETLDVLRTFWASMIKKVGGALLVEEGKDELIIGELVEFKDQLDMLIENSFNRDKTFIETEKESFGSIMNSRQNRPAELVAKYVDLQIRNATSSSTTTPTTDISMTAEQVESVLDKIIIIFRFIQGKDYFESVYKKDLARRLLFNRASSLEMEKSFLGKLKVECGSSFTSRLEGMFKDIEVSKEEMNSYRQQQHRRLANRDFSSTIINSGLWPHPPTIQANTPENIQKEQDNFESYYKTKYKGRRLYWHQNLGTCILKADFPLGAKELQLSIPQALVLLAFNKVDTTGALAYEEIKKITGLDDIILVKSLQSLACGKINILTKESKSREISINDNFVFNEEFTSKHNRIRVGPLSERDAGGEEPMINPSDTSPSDRQYQIDATIVRILKGEKRMKKLQLVEEISNQLQVILSDEEFSRRTVSLIEREFIGQDPADPFTYFYVV